VEPEIKLHFFEYILIQTVGTLTGHKNLDEIRRKRKCGFYERG
jgi:hypothetical protein